MNYINYNHRMLGHTEDLPETMMLNQWGPMNYDLMNLAEEQNLQNLKAFSGVEEKLESLKSSAGHMLHGIENLSIDEGKTGSSLGLELTENAMILPLIDAHGQTQLVVIDRKTQLAREILTSYFENGTVPMLTPPVIEEVMAAAPLPIVPVPFVEPVPIVAPAPVFVPTPE